MLVIAGGILLAFGVMGALRHLPHILFWLAALAILGWVVR
jgi:hypothetical protein